MKHYFTLLTLIFVFTVALNSNAAVLFNDDFQDPTLSKSKWIFDDSVVSGYGNGQITLQNKDNTYMRFVTHNLTGAKSPTFTLSATITLTSSASNGAGLVCCKTDTSGILVHLGTLQNLFVNKFSTKEQKIVLDVFNSFINPGINVVTVSKQGSTFNFFCNGNFISTVTISEALFTAGGDIGFILPTKSSAVFDNVVMTDDYATGSTRTCFSDDFNDADVNGWYTYAISGAFQSDGGKLSVSNNDTETTGLLFVHGDFGRSSLKTVTSFTSGKSVYGCMLVHTVPTGQGNAYKTYSFLVDSAQHYGVSNPDSSSFRMSLPKSFVHGAAAAYGGKDTLEVVRFNNRYEFKINGVAAENALPVPSMTFDAAGLYVGPKTSVSFEMFSVGGDSTGAEIPCAALAAFGNRDKRFAPLCRLPANGLMAIDALGRINKRFRGNYSGALQKGASGVYFLRSVNGDKSAPFRIILP